MAEVRLSYREQVTGPFQLSGFLKRRQVRKRCRCIHPLGRAGLRGCGQWSAYGLTVTHDFQRKLQLQRNSRGRVRVGCVPRSSLRRDRSGKLGRPGLIGDSSVSLQPGIVGKPFQFGDGDRANRVVTKPAVLGREIAGGRSSIRCIMHHSADAIWRSALYIICKCYNLI